MTDDSVDSVAIWDDTEHVVQIARATVGLGYAIQPTD